MMNTYELTVVLPGEATAAKKKSTQETIEKLVSTFEGKIEKTDDWGKIDLAYPIEKQESGNFIHYNIQLSSAAVKTVGDKLRLTDGIIRYLLVKKD